MTLSRLDQISYLLLRTSDKAVEHYRAARYTTVELVVVMIFRRERLVMDWRKLIHSS